MRMIFIGGSFGSDAPSWYIGADGKIHRFPGWEEEQISELSHILGVLREASQLKTPGVAEAVIGSVMELAQGTLGEHVGEGAVVVVG